MTNIAIDIRWIQIQVAESLKIHQRHELFNRADANIPIGTAPDGLPLVLRIGRAASVVTQVLSALHARDVDDLPPDQKKALQHLDQLVQTHRQNLGIINAGPAGHVPHYMAMGSIEQHLGPTLLCRILGPHSPILLAEDRPTWGRNVDEVAARTSCGVMMDVAELKRLQSELNTHQHFAIPLDDQPAHVVRRGKSYAVTEGRPVVFEDLRGFDSAVFHSLHYAKNRTKDVRHRGPLKNLRLYRKTLRKADCVAWSVSRVELLHMVGRIALAAAELHDDGLVHGDIKPANLLVTADGPLLHDSLDLKQGSLSAVGTRGWNAPEQIVASPVGPGTDIFALTQLACLVLDAAIFGDERNFVVPVGNGQRERMRLLSKPDVYLDPNLVDLSDQARTAWRTFLRKGLADDVDARCSDARAFAAELFDLTERHPPPGRRGMQGFVGRLHRGRDQLAWMIDDSYRGLARTPWRPWKRMAA